MAETTGIGWCDATFNPWWGCERVSPACAHCYAAEIASRYGFAGTWSENGPGRGEHGFRFFGDDHWKQPLRWARRLPAKLGRRPRVFCASMADVFEPRSELDGPRERLFALIDETPELDWLLLTKRIEEAAEYLDGAVPANVWLGTSVENQRFTWRADVLRDVPAAVRFISAEPLLGSLLSASASPLPASGSLPSEPGNGAVGEGRGSAVRAPLDLDGIDWLIIGGESGGRTARPMHPSWVRELRDDALDRLISIFFKQWGSWSPAGIGDVLNTRVSVGVEPNGRTVAPGLIGPGGDVMVYRGGTPKVGGKHLDGRTWCDFPLGIDAGVAA